MYVVADLQPKTRQSTRNLPNDWVFPTKIGVLFHPKMDGPFIYGKTHGKPYEKWRIWGRWVEVERPQAGKEAWLADWVWLREAQHLVLSPSWEPQVGGLTHTRNEDLKGHSIYIGYSCIPISLKKT